MPAASKSAPPPDVLFAQKASAVAKCAGLDPRSLDLEKFRALAPVIFARAYCAIYREELDDCDVEEKPQIAAQLVIEGLLSKTNVGALEQISGEDVCAGSHRAIGVLVGVLFAEGQRMWLAKQEEKRRQQQELEQSMKAAVTNADAHGDHHVHMHQQQVITTTTTTSSSKKKVKKVSKKSKGKQQQQHQQQRHRSAGPEAEDDEVEENNEEYAADFVDGGDEEGEDVQEEDGAVSNEQQLLRVDTRKSGGNNKKKGIDERDQSPSPKEIRQLMERVKYLEEKLQKVSSSGKGGRTGGGMGVGVPSRLAKSSSSSRKGAGRGGGRDDDEELMVREDDDVDEDGEDGISRQLVSLPAPAYKHSIRPRSAPSHSNKQPKRRILSGDGGGMNAAGDLVATNSEGENMPQIGGSGGGAMQVFISKFTYDMSSGRRILKSAAEMEIEEARRKREAAGNVKSLSEMETAVPTPSQQQQRHPPPPAPQLSPTRGPTLAEWPGETTKMSAEEWVRKAKLERNLKEQKALAHLEAVKELIRPRIFGAYKKLDKLDMVFSIEHCFQCHCHNVTLRHSSQEYVKKADFFLKMLAQFAHSCSVGVRVGVTRFHANITSKSRDTDKDSRIGAFEVQVACKNSKGEVVVEMLHSKLSTRRWPSKGVMEKRLRSFFDKHSLPTYYFRNATDTDDAPDYSNFANDGLGTYPIGIGAWSSTPLGEANWYFPADDAVIPEEPPAPKKTGGTSSKKAPAPASPAKSASATATSSSTGGAGEPEGVSGVQWVYDARGAIATPRFPIGTTVYVYGVSGGVGGAGRWPILAVVKSAPIDSTGIISIKPKYTLSSSSSGGKGAKDGDVEVHESLCVSLTGYVPPVLNLPPPPLDLMPSELMVCVLIAAHEGVGLPIASPAARGAFAKLQWQIFDPKEDRGGGSGGGPVMLCRNSFYHQIKILVGKIESKYPVPLSSSSVMEEGGGGGIDDDDVILVPSNTHPYTNKHIDLQLAYQEPTLDWVFSKLGIMGGGGGLLIDMHDFALVAHKAASALTSPPIEVKSSSSSADAPPSNEPNSAVHAPVPQQVQVPSVDMSSITVNASVVHVDVTTTTVSTTAAASVATAGGAGGSFNVTTLGDGTIDLLQHIQVYNDDANEVPAHMLQHIAPPAGNPRGGGRPQSAGTRRTSPRANSSSSSISNSTIQAPPVTVASEQASMLDEERDEKELVLPSGGGVVAEGEDGGLEAFLNDLSDDDNLPPSKSNLDGLEDEGAGGGLYADDFADESASGL